MRKDIVELAIENLAEKWKDANAIAWETVGRGGPVFTPRDLGDRDYVDSCLEAHDAQIEAELEAATKAYWDALAAAPVWLRLSRPWLKEAWKRAFVDRQNCYVGHYAMPFLEGVFERMGLKINFKKEENK